MPADVVTLVGGVNFDKYDATRHNIISNASWTTNCCAPVIKALLDFWYDNEFGYVNTLMRLYDLIAGRP